MDCEIKKSFLILDYQKQTSLSFAVSLITSLKPGFHMSGKSQMIGDFTFC